MNYVIPKWSAGDVVDWDDLLVSVNEGGRVLNLATSTILNYMPVIGITEITKENVVDTWIRISLIETVYGSHISSNNGLRRFYVTQNDVTRHIGIQTEGTSKTFLEFYKLHIEGVTKCAASESSAAYIANDCKTLLQIAIL